MMEFLIILVIIVAGAVVINAIEDHNKVKNRMSFLETLNLTGLPIVTFYQGDKKLNFLLDTGATTSNIDRRILNSIESVKTNTRGYTAGIEGINSEVDVYRKVGLTYNGNMYEAEMLPVDMSNVFDTIKKETGATLHGLLGSDFFTKYKYVLDFKDLVAYQK